MTPVFNIFGLAAVRISADDVLPERGLLQRHLIQFIGDMYAFAARPNLPPNVPQQMLPVINFQQGQFTNEDGIFPIHQLMLFGDGDAVVAANTEIAEIILEDYLEKLDAGLGFRYDGKPQQRSFVNNLVVEFERDIEDLMSGLNDVSEILTKNIPREGLPFAVKRLMFGFGDPTSAGLTSLELIERADFTIERRAGEPYERHRYFSSAPIRTADHIRILELIEAAAGARKRK